MTLKTLLSKISYTLVQGDENVEITSVVYDSRKVEAGSLFVCMKGFAFDGHAYIQSAIEAGAVAVLVQDAPAEDVGATVIQVEDTRYALALVSAAFFDYPAEKMTVIGLTGTKGKTTTAHMIKKILEESGAKVGMIGTIGAYIGAEKIPTRNTTPESYELHSLFSQMANAGCNYVVMEVSSQGLKLHRTAGITFNYGAFLNISPDHIGAGEHADFEEYMACKKLLFKQTENTIINIDADYWQEVTEGAKNPFTISLKSPADLMATNIHNIWEPGLLGVRYEMSGATTGPATLNIPGHFNVENALVATAIAHLAGISMDAILAGLLNVYVKGRTQLLKEVTYSTFLIDYAHNAISMESLLSTLKAYNPGRLICLFGGGGNKPKQRRFDMGAAAGKYADLTIITMDNPRFEAMEDINVDIIRGLDEYHASYETILDRQEAIEYLLDHCNEQDIVAFIGKGHEEYQEVNGEKFYFSEEKIVAEYIAKKNA